MAKLPRASNAVISSLISRTLLIVSAPVNKSSTYKCFSSISAALGYLCRSSSASFLTVLIARNGEEATPNASVLSWNVSIVWFLRQSIRWYRLSSSCNHTCLNIFSISAVITYWYAQNLIKCEIKLF